MSNILYVYVHGFNSSPQSYKARRLVEYFRRQGREAQVVVPSLSHWPSKAIATLEALIEEHPEQRLVFLGSSLGGYYATYLVERYGMRAVLINPAVKPYQLLQEWLGENQNIYTDERYQLTRAHLEQLLSIRIERIIDPGRYLLLTQTGDEVLDYREGVEFYRGTEMVVQPGGSHGFDDFDDYIPRIEAFAERD